MAQRLDLFSQSLRESKGLRRMPLCFFFWTHWTYTSHTSLVRHFLHVTLPCHKFSLALRPLALGIPNMGINIRWKVYFFRGPFLAWMIILLGDSLGTNCNFFSVLFAWLTSQLLSCWMWRENLSFCMLALERVWFRTKEREMNRRNSCCGYWKEAVRFFELRQLLPYLKSHRAKYTLRNRM